MYRSEGGERRRGKVAASERTEQGGGGGHGGLGKAKQRLWKWKWALEKGRVWFGFELGFRVFVVTKGVMRGGN